MGTSVTAVMPEGVALARDLVGPAMESAIARLTPDDAQLAAANASLADIDLAADVRAELTAIAEFITARTW
jgi:hypothetical protein